MTEEIITIKDDEIDVTKIMEQIRKNIKKRNIPDLQLPDLEQLRERLSNLNPEEFNRDELEQHITLNNMRWNISLDKPITSHRKYLGKLIIFGKRIIRKLLKWHMESLFGQQIEFNASVTRSLNEMKNYIKATDTQLTTYEEITKSLINTIEQKNAVIEALQKNVDALSASVVKTNKFVENEIFNELNSTKKAVDAILNENISDIKCEVEKILEELNDKSYDINEKVCNFKKKLRDTENKLNLVERETILTNSRLRRIERNLRNENYPIKEPTLEFQRKEKLDIDYLLFNERFGGSIKEIEDKFSQYISYFINKKNVLDIGCGRGVFLQLLTDNGVDCKGIDLDDDMILHCKEKGFNVEKVDAFSYLNSIDDNSLGGVFLGQVIEHMTPGEVLKLIRLSYQKLQPGAYFIAETINPQSLYVFTTSYLLDPSHIRMIHPETLKFMLETEGYNEVEVKYLSEVEEHLKIPKLEGNTENIKQFNESMEKLNNLIFGFRDYAVIGKR